MHTIISFQSTNVPAVKSILQGFSKYAFEPEYPLPSAFFLILKAVKKAKGTYIPLSSKYPVTLKRKI
jgi:hypothetical protein